MQSDIFSDAGGSEFIPLVGHLFGLFSCGPHGDVQIFILQRLTKIAASIGLLRFEFA